MFGLSFGEFVVLLVLGVVVIGPRNVPEMLRSLGRTIGKVRRTAIALREQSGIDEILRYEGLEREVAELRKIVQGRILEVDLDDEPFAPVRWKTPPRSREYPTDGPDTYGAMPETEANAYTTAFGTAPVISSPDGAGDRAPRENARPMGERSHAMPESTEP